MGIKHTFVSGKSDSSDSSLVRPSNWNDDHTIDGNISPDSDNAYSLGISGTSFSDLWIGSGGKIDFATGDAIIQHSTDTLAFEQCALAASSLISPTALAADADDYAPTGHAAAFAIRQDASADVSITGLAGGVAGRLVALVNISSANVLSLTDEDSNSTAANRFAIGATITLDSDSAVLLYYDGTSSRWRTLGGAGGGKATLSDTAPSGASAGKIWIRTTDFAAFVYYTDDNSSQWVQFGGGNGGGATPFIDSNGNEWLDVSATASAVNHVQITNSATGNDVKINAAGDDTNIDLQLDGKGTGGVVIGGATAQGQGTLNTENGLYEGGYQVDGVVLSSGQITGSPTTLDFILPTAGTGFGGYMIRVRGLQSTGTGTKYLSLRVGTGTGPTYQATNYNYAGYYWRRAGAVDSSGYRSNDSATGMWPGTTSGGTGDSARYVSSYEFIVHNPHQAEYTTVWSKGNAFYYTAESAQTGGQWRGTTAVTALRLYGAGTLADGYYELIGLKGTG
jgi:hypothetical protein